jgi:hypothetical protein
MKHTSLARRALTMLSLAAFPACVGGTEAAESASQEARLPPPPGPRAAYELPSLGSGDVVTYAASLTHGGAYAPLTAARAAAVAAMFDAVNAAIDGAVARTLTPNWCAVMSSASAAGYDLGRYYDTVSERWIIVGLDASGEGQASFFFNPSYRRDLVIEAPHVYDDNLKVEGRTDTEGAQIFQQTQARALLINGADRCQGTRGAACGGTFTSASVCVRQADENVDSDGDGTLDPQDMRYRTADVGHNDDTAFHALHQRLNDVWTGAVFAQLHGNDNTAVASGGLSVSDGRRWTSGSGLASTFAANLTSATGGGLATALVHDCTGATEILCGFYNAQARYTNDATATCSGLVLQVGGQRFLHLEQRAGAGTLVDAPAPVIDALELTVPCLAGGCSAASAWVPSDANACPAPVTS